MSDIFLSEGTNWQKMDKCNVVLHNKCSERWMDLTAATPKATLKCCLYFEAVIDLYLSTRLDSSEK